MPKNISIWPILILLWGCKSTPVAKNFNPVSLKPTAIKKIDRLNQATLVEIKNDWNGYSDITPIVRHFKLQPQAGNLTGNGYFAVGGYGAYDIHQQYTKKITIPTSIVDRFFQKLGETQIYSSAQYKPTITHADDYPAITIKVKLPHREVVFFSSSQGANHIPWQVKTQAKGVKNYYVSQSAAPDQALLLLKPYIDHPGLEQVISNRRSSNRQKFLHKKP